jgi:hypothetical protein
MPIVDRSLEAHREDYTNVQWRGAGWFATMPRFGEAP